MMSVEMAANNTPKRAILQVIPPPVIKLLFTGRMSCLSHIQYWQSIEGRLVNKQVIIQQQKTVTGVTYRP